MRVLTTNEVRQAERDAIARPGMSTLVLMQQAGAAVAQFCMARFKFNSVCVVCGKGNNGGDGLVAAEALRPTVAKISVIILAADVSALSPDAAAMCSRLQLEPIWVADETAFNSDEVRGALAADLIVDAVVGTGFKPPLRGLAKRAVEAINDASGTVVAVDLPSGVDADITHPAPESSDMVFAHGIVTFIAPKPAHVFGELTSGPIAVSEIGVLPAQVPNTTKLNAITGKEVGISFPPRPRDSNKGLFGHVLVVAGSLGKAGAAALAGRSALTTGAGLATVACPRSIQATVAGFAPEIMTEWLAETDEGSIAMAASEKIERLLVGKDAVVLGPGLSRNPATEEFARWLVANCPLPLVLDADGLNAFDGRARELKPRGEKAPFRALTPHPGEAARLLGISIKEIQADRVKMAKRISQETGSYVVLKGWRTLVAGSSGETWINMTGNAAMAKGGSGDVLSGMIGAALARHVPHSPIRPGFLRDVSVASAVYLHGLAGDFARDMLHENTVLAGNLPEYLTEAFHDCDQQLEQELFYLQK
jgi:NAD(P)H-hydrate epimerase